MWEKLGIHLLIYHHLFLSHLFMISMQIWIVIPMVVMWSHLLILRPKVPLILWILVCCVHPTWIPHVMFMKIKLWTELVLNNQPVLLFFMSMCGNLNKNLRWRMTFFCSHFISFIQTSSTILSVLFHLVKNHFRMFLFSIIQRTRGMLVFHLEFFGHGCHDLFIHSSNHDADFSTIDISKPPVFDDPSSDEYETLWWSIFWWIWNSSSCQGTLARADGYVRIL